MFFLDRDMSVYIYYLSGNNSNAAITTLTLREIPKNKSDRTRWWEAYSYILKSVGWLMAYPLVLLVLDNCLIIPKEVSCARVYKVYIYINLMSNDILENNPIPFFFY
jgi:hypothetical protein